MQNRIDLSVSQHLLDRRIGRHTLDLEIGARHKFYCLVQLAKPLDRVQRHPVFMLQDAAHPHDGGGLKLFDTDFPANEIAGSAYTLGGVDENESMAKPAMRKDRNGIYWYKQKTAYEIGRTRDFRGIKFPVSQKAPMPRC